MNLSNLNDPRKWSKWKCSGAVLPQKKPPADQSIHGGQGCFFWSFSAGRRGQLIALQYSFEDYHSTCIVNVGYIRVAMLGAALQKKIDGEISIPVFDYESRNLICRFPDRAVYSLAESEITIDNQTAEHLRAWLMVGGFVGRRSFESN